MSVVDPVDPAAAACAEAFLADEQLSPPAWVADWPCGVQSLQAGPTPATHARRVVALAVAIQQAVEDWLAAHPREPEAQP